jgi:hypothetical protein
VAKWQTSFDLDRILPNGPRFLYRLAHILWRSKPPELSHVLRRTRDTRFGKTRLCHRARVNELTDVTDRALVARLVFFLPNVQLKCRYSKTTTLVAQLACSASPSLSLTRAKSIALTRFLFTCGGDMWTPAHQPIEGKTGGDLGLQASCYQTLSALVATVKSVFIVGFVRTSILVCANQRTTPEMCPWDQKVLLSDSHPPIHTGTLLVAVAGRKGAMRPSKCGT